MKHTVDMATTRMESMRSLWRTIKQTHQGDPEAHPPANQITAGAASNKRAPTATKTRSQDLPSRQIPWQWQTSGSARHQDTNPCCSLCPIVRSALPLFSRHSLLRRSLVTSSLRHAESTRSWRQIAIHHLLPRPCTIITTLLLRGDPTKRRSRLPTSTLKWAVKDSHSRTT